MSEERTPPGALETIGPYRLLRPLGEGGMGEVYEALQEEPIHRRVALKLVRRGMDSARVAARFEAERQAIARMQHPHIAQVYDAGTAPDGRPYFVMELVDGMPITTFCDRERLGLRARLALFVDVCDAVQHAHRKGVIHRDLKPSNILVGSRDGVPFPKIIDFGVAKAIDVATDRAAEHGEGLTLLGELVGTPEYMCPERFLGDGSDGDIRSDVYSLGVVLYELLTGLLPIPREELGSAGLAAIYRRISSAEPPRPSTRLKPVTGVTSTISRHRSTNPETLRRHLVGDLDWITLRALEKDRDRRYGSVADMAADIGRHLDHRPVLAGPPSASYWLVKFARRHRVSVAAGLVILSALIIGVTGASVGWVRAQRAERVARESELEARRAETKALEEAETAEQVATFLENLFAASDPGEARGESVTARELLDRGAARVRGDLAGEPVLQARMMDSVARVYLNLGLFQEAQTLFEEALEIRRQHFGERHEDIGTSLAHLAQLTYRKGGYAEALPLLEQALAMQRATLGDGDLEVANRLAELGVLLYTKGESDRAEPLLRECLAIRRAARGADHPDVADAMVSLGLVLRALGDQEGGAQMVEESLSIRRRKLGDEHPLVAENLNILGLVYHQNNQHDAAEERYQEALAIRRARWGDTHPLVLQSLGNLGRLAHDRGDLVAAEAMFVQALEANRSLYDPHHPEIAMSLSSLGRVLSEQERFDEAQAHFTQAIDDLRRSFGDDHPHVAAIRFRLCESLVAEGDDETARPLLERVLAVRRATYGDENPRTRAVIALLDQID